MLHGTYPPGVAGSELTRLLARLSDAPAPDAKPALAERLGSWLGWTGAITLSAALSARSGAATAASATAAAKAWDAARADMRRVREALEAGIDAGPAERDPSPTDFGPYRRHCQACQQAMQEALPPLRQRLRQRLAAQSAQGAQLAAIDAALEPALDGQQRLLLALVPLSLQAHFERQASGDDPDRTGARTRIRDELQTLLRAELAHRLLPVQGLLAALNSTDGTT
jgi:Protein of unknown function (DUF3348)